MSAVDAVPRNAFLPVPRVPESAAARWPDPGLVEDLRPGAGRVVEKAAALRSEVFDAISLLEAGRPGGSDWRTAREADREAILASTGRKAPRPKHLAALMEGEPSRYATALALASTVSERMDALRGDLAKDPLIVTVDERRKALDEQISDAAFEAFTAAKADRKAAGYAALERFDQLAAQGRELLGLRRWMTGETTMFDTSGRYPVSTSVFAWSKDARVLLAGGSLADEGGEPRRINLDGAA